jgi:hypothetical protein
LFTRKDVFAPHRQHVQSVTGMSKYARNMTLEEIADEVARVGGDVGGSDFAGIVLLAVSTGKRSQCSTSIRSGKNAITHTPADGRESPCANGGTNEVNWRGACLESLRQPFGKQPLIELCQSESFRTTRSPRHDCNVMWI